MGGPWTLGPLSSGVRGRTCSDGTRLVGRSPVRTECGGGPESGPVAGRWGPPSLARLGSRTLWRLRRTYQRPAGGQSGHPLAPRPPHLGQTCMGSGRPASLPGAPAQLLSPASLLGTPHRLTPSWRGLPGHPRGSVKQGARRERGAAWGALGRLPADGVEAGAPGSWGGLSRTCRARLWGFVCTPHAAPSTRLPVHGPAPVSLPVTSQ